MKTKKIKISSKTSEYLRNGFGSLISNKCTIESAKMFPFWVSIILFLVSSFLPVIPTMISISNQAGRSIIASNPNYSMDKYLIGTLIELNQPTNDTEIEVIDVEGKKDAKLLGSKPAATKVEDSLVDYINKKDGKEYYGLRTYFYNSTSNDEINDFILELESARYLLGTTQLVTNSSSEPSSETSSSSEIVKNNYYCANFVVFTPIGFAIHSYKDQSEVSANTYSGDYNSYQVGTKLFETVGKVGSLAIPESIDKCSPEYYSGAYENLAKALDLGFVTIKNNTLVIYTFLYWGIYAVLELFLGLLMFLLTRGKKNFNNYLKWYTCMFIAFWASISPAILSLLLGLLLPSYGFIFFILLMGMRAMWLSMKQLAPTYQTNS